MGMRRRTIMKVMWKVEKRLNWLGMNAKEFMSSNVTFTDCF
jgi:hypothetical protein